LAPNRGTQIPTRGLKDSEIKDILHNNWLIKGDVPSISIEMQCNLAETLIRGKFWEDKYIGYYWI